MITEMVMLEAGLDYELREIDILNQQHQTDEYTEINPAALVPSLITPAGNILYEAPAINLYLAEHHGVEHLAPLTGDPDRGPFLSALFFITDELEPVLKRYYYPHRYVLHEEDANKMQEQSLSWAIRLLGIINKRLEQCGPYSLGQRYSLADLTLAFWMVDMSGKCPSDEIPAVIDCYQRVSKRPSIRHKFEELKSILSEYAVSKKQGKGVR
jgi:glutathione S-transferase